MQQVAQANPRRKVNEGMARQCLLVAAITSDADAATLNQPAIAFVAMATVWRSL
jgi:hypothetical protein